jgi:hypothetical protein
MGSAALAQTLTGDEKRAAYNLVSLGMTMQYCDDDYKFNMDVVESLLVEMNINLKEEKYQPVVQQASSEIKRAVDAAGITKYCSMMYSSIGGAQKGGLMLKR